MRPTAILVASLALAANAFCQVTDGKTASKALNEYGQSLFTEMRKAGGNFDSNAYRDKRKAKAVELTSGVDVEKIDAKTALDWASVFTEAGKYKEAARLAERFLGTNPAGEEKFRGQMAMANSLNSLSDGKKLADLVSKITPENAQQSMELAQSFQYVFVDTIKAKRGVNAALKVLDGVEKKAIYEDPKAYADRMIEMRKNTPKAPAGSIPATPLNGSGVNNADEAKMREQLVKQGEAIAANAKFGLASTRADLFVENKQKDKALDVLKKAIADIPEGSPVKRSATNQLTMLSTIGATAPKLNVERTIGDFSSLEALKGKVVLIDFFAHWCGPCIAAFPEMEKMYADLHGKGLEVVGLTTYYGYYKRENVQKRDMAKDVEFDHMKEFIAEHKLPWPVVYGDRSNFEAYGISGIPTVYVIDKAGTVHKYKVGYDSAHFDDFRKEIEGMLAK